MSDRRSNRSTGSGEPATPHAVHIGKEATSLSPSVISDGEFPTNQSLQGSISASAGFQFLQSIKDLTHQELYRANPLGLLGKEIISVTGTTHCPEPIPPKETEPTGLITTSPSKLASIHENESQQLQFPRDDNERVQRQRRPSTLPVLAPYPVDFIPDGAEETLQPHLFSQPSPTTLIADFIPDTMTINVFEVFIYAWGVLAFFLDMVTDLVLAHAYYLEGAYWLFILTLMCVILPNLTLSIFSLAWYIDGCQLKAAATRQESTAPHASAHDKTDRSPMNCEQNSFYRAEKSNGSDQTGGRSGPNVSKQSSLKRRRFQLSAATANVLTWMIRIIILVLQLDLCLKYIRGLYYTWKGFQKRHDPKWQRFYLTKQILIDADIALLRVFDCFMDSGSQVVLQLYIMLRLGSTAMKYDTLFLKQSLSIVSSLGSLAYALSGYSRCWRHMQLTHSPQGWPKGKPPPKLVSWWSTIVQWFWYLFLITPRVLALAMFAATFRSWFWIILAAHWWGMLFWILRFRTIFCISDQTKYNPREAIFEKCYNLVCSYIFIFCYMNLRKGDTRTHYIAFYTIYYIENIAFSIIYAVHSAETNLTLKYSLVIFVCSGFWLAVLFQVVYYRFLHPSDHVRLSTKHHVSSLVHVRAMSSRFDRMNKSKSCEDMIEHHDVRHQHENHAFIDTASVQSPNPADERWMNRFSKENRQKLISQQQAIDHKVKVTRAQKQREEASQRQHRSSHGFRTKAFSSLTQPTIVSTTVVPGSAKEPHRDAIVHQTHAYRCPDPTDRQKRYARMQPDDQISYEPAGTSTLHSNMDTVPIGGGKEMILTAAKLAPHVVSTSSSINSGTSTPYYTPLASTASC